MNVTMHQTHHMIADFSEIFNYIQENFKSKAPVSGLHLFPELFLTGYPLQDICLQKSFIQSYQKLLKKIEKHLQTLKTENEFQILMGGLLYDLNEEGIPNDIYNVIYSFHQDSMALEPVYKKRLLPNYDIFDEEKYYTPGQEVGILEFGGKKIGLLICEDMWASTFHDIDPVKELYQHCKNENLKLDLIINLSASPYIVGKTQDRLIRGMEISNTLKTPFCYCNRVGGEDEILFDGQSFICDGKKAQLLAPSFETAKLTWKLKKSDTYQFEASIPDSLPNSWEALFRANLNSQSSTHGALALTDWDDETTEEVIKALTFGVQEYAKKSKFQKFTIALSGGMDSALVLTLLKLSLQKGQHLEAIYMPSIHSSTLSWDLSLELCKNLQIPLHTIPIKFLHSTTKNTFGQTFKEPFEGLTDENIQSRLRGTLLYTRSNQIGSMVVNTSNKSELAVGYSTQYGDSVGAISLLGDIYKSQVFHLAKYLNKKYNGVIPEGIIARPPSAELREGQVDTESLPPYEILDAILEGLLSYRYTEEDLKRAGFPDQDVEKVIALYTKTEYKRYQFCPIIKINAKSFGFGYRVPINKDINYYNSKIKM